MKRYVVLTKRVGETPLMALNSWRAHHPAYADVPLCYAGRLDPMAEGKLLVLIGDECKKQEAYHGLDKEYEIEVLLDAGSDTGDALGIVSYAKMYTRVDLDSFPAVLRAELGTHTRPYPAFSSKTVGGKPLFLRSLEDTLPLEMPTHEERIYRIRIQDGRRISKSELAKRVDAFLALAPKAIEESKALGADFRINEVQTSWKKFFGAMPERNFAIITLRVTCGAGTYMRALASRIGEALGTQGFALSIKRTRIGRYWNGFWIRSF